MTGRLLYERTARPRRATLRSTFTMLVVLSCLAAVAAATSTPTASAAPVTSPLPSPAGSHPVGRTTMHIIDPSHADPWHPERRRELMVTVAYPAARTTSAAHPRARYVSTEAGTALSRPGGPLPPTIGDLVGIRTHAFDGAPAARAGASGFPVVLYSPGVGVPRILGTAGTEDLASRGFVVVPIDHTYETQLVEFPGGRVVEGQAPPKDAAASTAWLKKALTTRVDDTRLVVRALGDLTGPLRAADSQRLPAGLDGALNLSRIGMHGHSLGGFTAAEAVAGDPRFVVGADLDGTLGFDDGTVSTAVDPGTDNPFLLVGSRRNATDPRVTRSWGSFLADARGPRRLIVVDDAAHYSFTDLPFLIPPGVGVVAPGVTSFAIWTVEPGRPHRIVAGVLADLFLSVLQQLAQVRHAYKQRRYAFRPRPRTRPGRYRPPLPRRLDRRRRFPSVALLDFQRFEPADFGTCLQDGLGPAMTRLGELLPAAHRNAPDTGRRTPSPHLNRMRSHLADPAGVVAQVLAHVRFRRDIRH